MPAYQPGETRPSPPDPDPASTQPSQTAPPGLGATRVLPARGGSPPMPPKNNPGGNSSNGPRYHPFMALLPFALLAVMTISFSGWLGYHDGNTQFARTATTQAQSYLEEQYQLGLQDMQNGQFELARQRFEFIYVQNPTFEEAAQRWVEISLILAQTATPTPPSVTATITVTPTIDPRPKEELLAAARNYLAAGQWDQALQTLTNLRGVDPAFHAAEVDGMVFIALRNRGVEKILNQGDLEGGLYDFSLAERYGYIDLDASIYQGWAHLYLQGNGFWLAYPEIAAGYYGQVAGLAPNLRDGSGMTAFQRYWASLVHIGDAYAAKEDWCAAAVAYRVALSNAYDGGIEATTTAMDALCLALTPSATPIPTETPTLFVPSQTATIPGALTSTPTLTGVPGVTVTPTTTVPVVTPISTVTLSVTLTHTTLPNTLTNTPVPPTATLTPVPPTNTSVPTVTETTTP